MTFCDGSYHNSRPSQGKTVVRGCYGVVNPNLICAFRDISDSEAATVCDGDSGSSIGRVRNGHFELDGVTSFADGWCELFSMFTAVHPYLDWIQTVMGGDRWE